MTQKDKPIAFQGEMGANSHIACNDIFPDRDVLPCREGHLVITKGFKGFLVLKIPAGGHFAAFTHFGGVSTSAPPERGADGRAVCRTGAGCSGWT